jgi:hypothetical protein
MRSRMILRQRRLGERRRRERQNEETHGVAPCCPSLVRGELETEIRPPSGKTVRAP